MTIHSSTTSLLKESIPEFVRAAEFCVAFQKDSTWGQAQIGGSLGCPAMALLFCVADSMGSYHRGKLRYSVPIDGKREAIKKKFHHFYIFNSDYYGLALTKSVIEKLRDNYRCLLVHNSALAENHAIFMGDPAREPFVLDSDKVYVNVPAFLRVTQMAVSKFLQVIDTVVPGSEQEKEIRQKR
jgi:hypothetical protein